MDSAYTSARLAAAYAFDRPPIHEQILSRLALPGRATRALDVGCGAGCSTAALTPYAESVVGLEPEAAMLIHSDAVSPKAHFAVGRAEQIPFASATFDLITAAGSLNYANLDLFFPEVARVLTADGLLVIYDFYEGKRACGTSKLETWFNTFEQRYPWPTDYHQFSLYEIGLSKFGLRLDSQDEFEVLQPMSLDTYMRYALSDVNIDRAIASGAVASDIRQWCQTSLDGVFEGNDLEVIFEVYAACVRHAEAAR